MPHDTFDEDGWTRRAMIFASLLGITMAPLGCKTKFGKLEDPGKVAGKGMTEAKKRIKKHIADKTRRNQALDKLEEAQAIMSEIGELTVDAHDERVSIPIAQQTETHLKELMVHYQTLIRAKFVDFSNVLLSMRTCITEAEWLIIFPRGQA